ncbi:MAG: nucleotidyltransferase domain-containing protein [Salinivirgaceae bacterium]|jgi:predicted nucleotidyltransferase
MSKKEQIIQKLIGVINKTAPDSEMYLYGSQARGDEKKLSDWDLLILLNSQKISFDFETRLMDEFYDIELETGAIISPLIYSKTDWNGKHSVTPLFKIIKREGIRLI